MRDAWEAGQRAGYEVLIMVPLPPDVPACAARAAAKRYTRAQVEAAAAKAEAAPAMLPAFDPAPLLRDDWDAKVGGGVGCCAGGLGQRETGRGRGQVQAHGQGLGAGARPGVARGSSIARGILLTTPPPATSLYAPLNGPPGG